MIIRPREFWGLCKCCVCRLPPRVRVNRKLKALTLFQVKMNLVGEPVNLLARDPDDVGTTSVWPSSPALRSSPSVCQHRRWQGLLLALQGNLKEATGVLS